MTSGIYFDQFYIKKHVGVVYQARKHWPRFSRWMQINTRNLFYFDLSFGLLFMSLMMRVSQRTREGHHGQMGGRAAATLAVNMGKFLGAPRPVKGHWPSIISYRETL